MKKTLPTLLELHDNVEVAHKNDQFNLLVNQEPPKAWVKKNPYAGNTSYLPIDKVEMMLTRIFQQWKLEVIRYNQLFNSVAVQVRLHYLNPTNGEWMFQDGLGAVSVQTDKGKEASNLNAIKSNAVMMALPAAESYALKDAAEKIGILFGANLNRKDTMAFSAAYTKKEDVESKRVREYCESATNINELNEFMEKMIDEDRGEFAKMASERIDELQSNV